jgi:hypothetical protein
MADVQSGSSVSPSRPGGNRRGDQASGRHHPLALGVEAGGGEASTRGGRAHVPAGLPVQARSRPVADGHVHGVEPRTGCQEVASQAMSSERTALHIRLPVTLADRGSEGTTLLSWWQEAMMTMV